MSNLIKSIAGAIKSRRNYNGEVTSEQKRRLNICKKCPLNSDNKKQLSFKDKAMLFLNKALDFIMNVEVSEEAICTKCSCNLIHKSSQEEVELKCPLKKW